MTKPWKPNWLNPNIWINNRYMYCIEHKSIRGFSRLLSKYRSKRVCFCPPQGVIYLHSQPQVLLCRSDDSGCEDCPHSWANSVQCHAPVPVDAHPWLLSPPETQRTPPNRIRKTEISAVHLVGCVYVFCGYVYMYKINVAYKNNILGYHMWQKIWCKMSVAIFNLKYLNTYFFILILNSSKSSYVIDYLCICRCDKTSFK